MTKSDPATLHRPDLRDEIESFRGYLDSMEEDLTSRQQARSKIDQITTLRAKAESTAVPEEAKSYRTPAGVHLGDVAGCSEGPPHHTATLREDYLMSTLHDIDDDHIVDDDIVVIPAVIYAAKSTQDRNQSIPEQLDDCRQMARENDWEIIGEYVDENFTAYTGNRGPGLAAAIEATKAAPTPERWTMLVAQHTSRFARGDGARPGAPKALVELYHEWARASVRGRLVENDRAMASSAAAAQQGEADHLESERKSTSVKKGMRRRARDRGKLSGGIRPYGYRWTGPKAEKRLELVPAEAQIVRRIFNDTIAGVSQMALARTLTNERVPTMHGGAWLQATVGQMLRNPLYKGLVRNNGHEYPGDHQPIVTAELWERAARMRSRAAHHRPPRRALAERAAPVHQGPVALRKVRTRQ